MRVTIRYFDGWCQPGMLLVSIGPRMRVALPGSDDIKEFRWVDGQWLSESNDPVTIDFFPPNEAFERFEVVRDYLPAGAIRHAPRPTVN